MSFNILVTDDSATSRAFIIKTLAIAEIPLAELHEATDGIEALEILKDHWVDLVLADLNMPRMGGEELIAHMREDVVLATVPVVVISSVGSHIQIERIRSLGVSAYIRKPFTPETLRDVAYQALGVHSEV